MIHNITLHPKLMFILCVWILFVTVSLRAIMRGSISKQARQLWLMFFLSCVAFTFWGEKSELYLDQFFGDRPIALFIKYISMVSVAHLFYLLLDDVKPQHALIPMKWMTSVAIAIGFLGILIHERYKPFSREDLRYLFIGARDAVVLIYVLLSFIPGTLKMRQNETVDMMRFKLNLIVLTSLCFIVTAAGSIVAAIWTFLQIGDPAIAASAVQPFVVFGIILFILTMIPYRWIFGFFHLRRFYIHYRLLSLEKRMLRRFGTNSIKRISISIFIYPKELELSIYRTTISVLDFYPSLAQDDSNPGLYARLHACIETSPTYDELVQEMARL